MSIHNILGCRPTSENNPPFQLGCIQHQRSREDQKIALKKVGHPMIGIHTGNFSRKLPSQLGGIQHQRSEENNGQTIRILKNWARYHTGTNHQFVSHHHSSPAVFLLSFSSRILKLFPSPFTTSIIGNLFPIARTSWHCISSFTICAFHLVGFGALLISTTTKYKIQNTKSKIQTKNYKIKNTKYTT